MTKTLKELALAAHEIAGDVDTEEVFQYILDSAKSQHEFLERSYESFIQFANTDFDEVYTRYADAIGTVKLTDEQKTQAILGHVLEKYADD